MHMMARQFKEAVLSDYFANTIGLPNAFYAWLWVCPAPDFECFLLKVTAASFATPQLWQRWSCSPSPFFRAAHALKIHDFTPIVLRREQHGFEEPI